MRWLWVGGWIGLVGVVFALWPQRQPVESDEGRPLAHAVIPRPHVASRSHAPRGNALDGRSAAPSHGAEHLPEPVRHD